MRSQIAVMLVSMALVADLAAAAEPATSDWSRRPMRPLPAASARPLATGPARFVDARQGADKNDGSQAKPWRTLQHAVNQLKPGDTLYLRAGNYDEHVTMTASGTRDKPITLRSYPGELAVIDGCLTEFRDAPAQAWEPCPDGVEGEFRSTKAYPHLGGKEGDPNLLGSFAESMVPLEGYRFHRDLQSSNPYWNVDGKTLDKDAVYCGPGVFYDVATGRIHARLAHTQLPGLEDDNYRGPTDPRQVSLVIGAHAGGSPLTLDGVSHVRLQDLVVRGARESTLQIIDGYDIELDGLTLYGGADALKTLDTVGLRVYHSALRGISAPWTFRGSLKYRSIEARIVRTGGWNPSGAESSDFEFAYCEFTDSVDGVFVGNVHRVRFHHNLLENLSDDGIF